MAGNIELYELEVGPDHRWSATDRYALRFTPSGNLEVWHNVERKVLWQSGTAGRGAAKLALEPDGNLVIYDHSRQPLWDSGTAGNHGAVLTVQDDGNVVLYSSDRRPLWHTATYED